MAKVIQVRGVPEETHAELTRVAAQAGLSLNRYLLKELERVARRGRNAEVLKRAQSRPGRRLTSEQIVTDLRELREHGE